MKLLQYYETNTTSPKGEDKLILSAYLVKYLGLTHSPDKDKEKDEAYNNDDDDGSDSNGKGIIFDQVVGTTRMAYLRILSTHIRNIKDAKSCLASSASSHQALLSMMRQRSLLENTSRAYFLPMGGSYITSHGQQYFLAPKSLRDIELKLSVLNPEETLGRIVPLISLDHHSKGDKTRGRIQVCFQDNLSPFLHLIQEVQKIGKLIDDLINTLRQNANYFLLHLDNNKHDDFLEDVHATTLMEKPDEDDDNDYVYNFSQIILMEQRSQNDSDILSLTAKMDTLISHFLKLWRLLVSTIIHLHLHRHLHCYFKHSFNTSSNNSLLTLQTLERHER